MGEHYICKLDKLNQLIEFNSSLVKWIDADKDFDLIQEYYKCFGANDLNKEDFNNEQWKFCALIEKNHIISFAGALYMTSKNWEIGAVSTHPLHRNKGYAKIVCSFVAKYILSNNKQATCSTNMNNHGMIKVMHQIGMVKQ